MSDNKRIDKWLWCVRLYKTRTLATESVKGGKVKLNGETVKASKELKPGDEISFKFSIITKTVRVLDFPAQRLAAKLVAAYMEDLTPGTEYQKLKNMRELGPPVFHTAKGRPTKKNRRKLDDIF